MNKLNLESEYIDTVDRNHRKTLGQFFTPVIIADLMADWVKIGDPVSILDPAAGTGVLIRSIRKVGLLSDVVAHEIDEKVITFCESNFKADKRIDIIKSDYLTSRYGEKFDAIIANPPYIRHHDFKISKEDKASIESNYGKLPNTSNIYVYFVLKILLDLKPNGRASIIIPSDWLNSNFGRSFKRILFSSGYISKVLYFRNDIDPFTDNLSTATILFIDKGKKNRLFELGVVTNLSDTFESIAKNLLHGTSHEAIATLDPDLMNPILKWGPIFEGSHTEQPDGWVPIRDLFKSRRGIATGANNYFLVSKTTLKKIGVDKKRSRACIGRSKDIAGIIFKTSDYTDLVKADSPGFLLDLDSNYSADAKYIKDGSDSNLPERFLLANRNPWFKQESRPPAQILVGVFGRDGVRFIWNQTSAINLTTFHGLYADMSPEDIGVVVAILNSSLLQSHNKKTERSYGGGLQKVEPKDLLDMEIPDPRKLSVSLKDQLLKALLDADEMRRAGIDSWRTPLDFVVAANRELLNI